MSWVAAAVVGGAVIGAVGQRQAGKTAAKGQTDASATLLAAANKARNEIIPRFEQARIAQREGFGGALNLLQQTPEQVTRPFQEGNIQAQQQVGRGLGQVQRALLGAPVDLSGFQARTVEIPDLVSPQPDPPALQAPVQIPTSLPGPFQRGTAIGREDPRFGTNRRLR